MWTKFGKINNGPTSKHCLPALLYITNVTDRNGHMALKLQGIFISNMDCYKGWVEKICKGHNAKEILSKNILTLRKIYLNNFTSNYPVLQQCFNYDDF